MCAFCDLLGKNSKIFKIRRVILNQRLFRIIIVKNIEILEKEELLRILKKRLKIL